MQVPGRIRPRQGGLWTKEEQVMRVVVVALGALALACLVASSEPASAAKTKMGCERGKQVWNATLGQCVAGKSKYAAMARKSAKKGAPKTDAKKKQ
jgi:hypothetical protein